MYIFASDPHGTGMQWITKVEKAHHSYPTAKIVFGGDYIDGRKYSKTTVDYVKTMHDQGHIALMGNHEQLMLNSLKNPFDNLWDINGAKTTIKSFCGRSWSYPKRLYKFEEQNYNIINWISKLPDIYITENIIFVHAGLDLTLQDPLKTSHTDKLWLRDDYFYQPNTRTFAHNTLNKTIISGHTPTTYLWGKYDEDNRILKYVPESCPVVTIQYKNEAPRIFTDGGCHSSLPDNLGNVVVLNDDGIIIDIY